jgi:hypothetical protein
MMLLIPAMLLLQQSPTVTATFAPTPVPKAWEILSQAAGKRLDSVPALDDEVIVARLKNAPLATVLSHLADALCAKWVERPGGILRLVPNSAAERKLEQAKEAKREEDFYKGIQYIKRRLAEEPAELNLDDVKATAAKLDIEAKRQKAAMAAKDMEHMFVAGNADEESPSWRAAGQIALLIEPKTLLDMPEDAREVWAENPTTVQHAFPDGSDLVLARYRRELSLTDPNAVVARVKISIQREEALYLRFSALDTAGRVLDRAVFGLSNRLTWTKLPASKRPQFAIDETDAAANVPPEQNVPVSVPEEAKEARIALATSIGYRNPDQGAMIRKARPRFLDPVKYEPTQWHVGEDLVLAAEATGKNLIGTVSDHIGGKFLFAGSRNANALKPTPSEILAKNKGDLMPTTDGWLVVRSSYWQYRWSRHKAKAFLDEGIRMGGITVDAAAAWVAPSTDSNPVYDWMWDYLQVLFSGPGSFNSGWDGRSLKLWASLGPENINLLRRGGTIQLSMLPPETQSKIAQGVYWYRWLDDPADPTDKLPNGINDGTLTVTVTESTVMHGGSPTDDLNAANTSLTPESIGQSLALGNTYYRTLERWQIGVHRVFDLHFIINPGKVPMTVSLDESIFDPNAEILTKLPDNVLAEIEKAKQYALAHPQPPGEYPPSAPPAKSNPPPP